MLSEQKDDCVKYILPKYFTLMRAARACENPPAMEAQDNTDKTDSTQTQNPKSYPPAFERAVARLLGDEGGYVDNPADPGGETKFGITKREYPQVDIAALTRAEAIAIYFRDWWQRYRWQANCRGRSRPRRSTWR